MELNEKGRNGNIALMPLGEQRSHSLCIDWLGRLFTDLPVSEGSFLFLGGTDVWIPPAASVRSVGRYGSPLCGEITRPLKEL